MRHRSARKNWKVNGKLAKSCKMTPVVRHNIEVVDKYRADLEREKGFSDHIADWITIYSGSMVFVFLHVIWFGVWILANVGWFGLTPFDPYPYGLLTTIVSLEAIFLSTFVLVSQNRQAELSDRRSELDLQVNLLAEYEMTRLLTIMHAIAERVGCTIDGEVELDELEKEVKPGELLKQLDKKAKAAKNGKH